MQLSLLHKIKQRYASKWLILVLDIFIVLCTLFIAYVIRYNLKLSFDIPGVLKQMPFVAIAAAISFMLVNSHKGVIRFTGYRDVVNVIIGANILATILLISTYLSRKFEIGLSYAISGTVIYIHLLLNVLFLIGFRFFIKSLYRSLVSDFQPKGKVLIYGAGNSGMITYDALQADRHSSLEVVGFVDDNPKKIGKKINLLNVYKLEQITEAFVKKHELTEVIVSIQNINPARLLEITTHLFDFEIKVKIVPPVQNWIDGDLSIGQIKDVKIDDLLGREPIVISNPVLDEEYNNKIILVTGAAGSIGSEISRKLIQLNPKNLILLDNSESPLYDLQQEFLREGWSKFTPEIADVRDDERIKQIFNRYKPKIVFHAAAYKHVPLMESNPYEAVRSNVGGTICMADLSVEYGVDKFVFISTDKAVNPTNVMGATKRIAELYVSCLKGQGRTKFITTRFGNVLGSSGSVIPLFKKQIEIGGPVTVTHPEITRFFMTISEASQLVLEAAAMGNGGEIFVFDMGKPVKIYDLARNMIFLSGKSFPQEINIQITGLRPGEKIYEELLADGENTVSTYHEKILIAKTNPLDIEKTKSLIQKLVSIRSGSQPLEIVVLIKQIVPEYISKNSKYEFLDQPKY